MKNNTDLFQWLKKNLQDILPCLVSNDIVQYIMSIENLGDLEDFMISITDTSQSKYKQFLENYKKVRCLKEVKNEESDDTEYSVKHRNKSKCSENNSKDKKSGSSDFNTVEAETRQKKKTKYVNLYSADGKQKDVILLKGRHVCECQASKHKLVNNCLNCGRIVCEQEGMGPCLFCGMVVFSKEDLEIINSNDKQSRKLYNSIMESIAFEDVNKAVERRNKLLDYDKSFSQRTRVIDDEGEYYSSSSVWLNKEEREKLKKKEEEAHAKKHESRLQKKFTLDFAGRTVIEEDSEEFKEEFYAEALSKIEASLAERYLHPTSCDFVEPVYKDPKTGKTDGWKHTRNVELNGKLIKYVVQDRELLEMTDNGVCLSLHQPWASLLINGVMRYEGRTWYTSHRGRLWIAATSKQPTEQEIKDAERFFTQVRHGEDLNFPKSYPTSCLLGCVSIADCLPQEEFRLKYPDGECDSPFVFVCEDPRSMDTYFPVSGSHKIYKLDAKIHQAANKVLLRMAKDSKF